MSLCNVVREQNREHEYMLIGKMGNFRLAGVKRLMIGTCGTTSWCKKTDDWYMRYYDDWYMRCKKTDDWYMRCKKTDDWYMRYYDRGA